MPIATDIGHHMSPNISPRNDPPATSTHVETLSQIKIKAPPDEDKIQWQRQMAFYHDKLIIHAAVYRDLINMMDKHEDPPQVWLAMATHDINVPPRTFWGNIATRCDTFLKKHEFPDSLSRRRDWTTLCQSLRDAALHNLPLPVTSQAIDKIHFSFRPETLSARAMAPKVQEAYWGMILMAAYLKIKQSATLFAYIINELHLWKPLEEDLWHHTWILISTKDYWDKVINSYGSFSAMIDRDRMPEAYKLVVEKRQEAIDARGKNQEPPNVLTYQSELHLQFRTNSHQTAAGLDGFKYLPVNA
jgi:hypothetical protein